MLGKAYLHGDNIPNALGFTAAPPDTLSPLFIYDYMRYEWGKSVRQTKRGEQAAHDADYRMPYIASYFAPALGICISDSLTPALYKLISNVAETASCATFRVKKHYARRRPYVQFDEPTLVRADEESHRHSGSFPSGHTSIGWAVALVLTELCPDRADTLLALGYQYGESRVIAGYHYQSDVDQGRSVGAAALARMHAEVDFLTDLGEAREELSKVRQMPEPVDTEKVSRALKRKPKRK